MWLVSEYAQSIQEGKFMSVRVNDRRLSELEYENTYYKIYSDLAARISRIPVRYRVHLANGMNDTINKLLNTVTSISLAKKNSAEKYRRCQQALCQLEELAMWIYTYWNLSDKKNGIKRIPIRSRSYLANQINREMRLIEGVMKKCNKPRGSEIYVPEMMIALSRSKINDVIFLQKLSRLEHIVYGIAVQTSKVYQDAAVNGLLDSVRTSFSNAAEGNCIFAKGDTALVLKRCSYFDKAISSLYSSQKYVRLLSCSSVVSEKNLSEICSLITDSIRILKSIKGKELSSIETQ